MKVIIAGAGIGGLTASIALSRLGHTIEIFEQAVEPKPVGAGISLQPNARQALATLELDTQVAARAFLATSAEIRFDDGALVRRIDFRKFQDAYNCLPITIHRGDLFDVLHRRARELGVVVHFGHPFQSYRETSDGLAIRAGDTEINCDALIGADGINSSVREQVVGETPKLYSGYVCWRGIVAKTSVVQSVTAMHEFWGRGARFGFMRCREDLVYWFATKTTRDRRNVDHRWKQLFQDWPDPIGRLIAHTDDDQILFNDICDRDPIFPWSRGAVTLLGDAAHPMTPNFGQGGAQAIEDAVVLGHAMKRYPNAGAAFDHYQRHRSPRTAAMVRGSRQFGKVAQGGNPLWRFARRRVLPWVPVSTTDRMLDDQLNFHRHLDMIDV